MSTAADADEARERLKLDLTNGLIHGYPEKRQYVPRSWLQKHVTRATITRCLPSARRELIDFILVAAPKIFAILLYSDCLPKIPQKISLESALQTCKDKRLTDAELPFPSRTEPCCSEERTICRHRVAKDVLGNWNDHYWERFCTAQWMFLALEFVTGTFEYILDERGILPIKLCDGYNEGFFGEVREGLLNQDHARTSEQVSLKLRNVDHC